MFERLTPHAREVVKERAQEAARGLGDDRIDPEHLLLGLLATDPDRQGVAARVLAALGVTTEAVNRELAASKRTLPGRLGPADAEALAAIGIDLEAIRRKAEQTFGPGALERSTRQRRGRLPMTKQAGQALGASRRQAVDLGHHHIGTEHLLLGLLEQPDELAAATLRALNAPPEMIRARVREELRSTS